LELIPADPENTKALERYLMEIDTNEPDPESLANSRKRKQPPQPELDQLNLRIRIPQKR
jgi:hypothetical protein